ncbi:MAG: AbrB family transcriptional regulator [Nocardioidaceae bacterium]
MRGRSHALLLLAGGAAGALVLTVLQIPAGTLIGAVVGSALASRLPWAPVSSGGLPTPVRTVGLVLLGCAAGVNLDLETLQTLARIAVPLVASVLALLLLNLALAAVLVRRYGIDPLTAALACAPGGISEVSITASQMGAQMGVVLAVHTVRVLAVVLLVLPSLIAVLGTS